MQPLSYSSRFSVSQMASSHPPCVSTVFPRSSMYVCMYDVCISIYAPTVGSRGFWPMPTTSPEGCENFRLPRLGPAKKTVIVVLLVLSLPACLLACYFSRVLFAPPQTREYVHEPCMDLRWSFCCCCCTSFFAAATKQGWLTYQYTMMTMMLD